jgi:hypothetical protein
MTKTSFTQPIHAPARIPGGAFEPVLDAERLDVFHVAVQFHGLVPELARHAGRSLRDQLERASASIALNLCEGCARRAPGDKAQFFAIAPHLFGVAAVASRRLMAHSLKDLPNRRDGVPRARSPARFTCPVNVHVPVSPSVYSLFVGSIRGR